MKLTVFSHEVSIDYKKVGGLESLLRRISNEVIEDGHEVEFVLYGSRKDALVSLQNGVKVRYTKGFTKSLRYLQCQSNSVISNYIKKRHRLLFYIFRAYERNRISFFRIQSGIENSKSQRMLAKVPTAARLAHLFEEQIALSETIHKNLTSIGIDAKLCLPPVPEVFFVPKSSKPATSPLEVTFVGRLDENKGISSALELFQDLAKCQKFNLNISGYYGHGVSPRSNIENAIKNHPEINFHELSWKQWSNEVDYDLISLLERTDVLILPYKNLSGTMDPPYLILEGMAARCVILTTNVGSIGDYLLNAYQATEAISFARRAYDYIHSLDADRTLLSDIKSHNQNVIRYQSQAVNPSKGNKWVDIVCK